MSASVETTMSDDVFRFSLAICDVASAGAGAAALTERVDPFLRRHSLTAAETAAVQTAIEELIVNIGVHGRPGGGEASRHCQGEIRIEAERLVFVLADDAPPFDPRERPKPDLSAPAEQRRIGGLGLHLLFSFFNAMEYARQDGRNISRWILWRGGQKRT